MEGCQRSLFCGGRMRRQESFRERSNSQLAYAGSRALQANATSGHLIGPNIPMVGWEPLCLLRGNHHHSAHPVRQICVSSKDQCDREMSRTGRFL